MYYGVSYYPEHKKKKELDYDLDMIIKSGINTVRMGEFAWCRFEPNEGEFDFSWLDKVVERLGKAGISTIICTPTACPPVWIIEKHPEILYMDNRRIRRPFGGRRHYCYNNEDYRRYSAIIAEKIGKHYGDNPYVVGFQIDNEPAQEGTGRCCCPACEEKFHNWLKNKYIDIDSFNKRSGSIFWSQEYTDFSQVNIPVNTIEVSAQQQIDMYYENPTIRLEFERFSSESQIEYQHIQTHILKSNTKYPVTTNGTGLATNSINNYESAKELDLYAFDYYPNLRDAKVDSFPYAFARGVKSGKAFWIMEFMSGGGHRLSGSGRLQPNPGALKQTVIHSLAHGAQMMLHFQYRSFPIGAEQLNYSIVDMDGVPRRRYYEMKETAEVLKTLAPLEDSLFANEAAVVMDYDSHWAHRIKPANDPDFSYLDYCGKLYNNLMEIGVNADVISLNADFSMYKLLILPAAFVLEASHQMKLKQFVKDGGVLLTTFLTSVKTKDNLGYTTSLPAGLTDLFGVVVEEAEPVFESNHTQLEIKLGDDTEATICEDGMWSELLTCDNDVKKVGKYIDDYKKDKCVISKNNYGIGSAYYLGTDLPDEVMTYLLDDICLRGGLEKNIIRDNKNIEVVRRLLNGAKVYYVFNFSCIDTKVTFNGILKDYLSNNIYDSSFELERNGYKILID